MSQQLQKVRHDYIRYANCWEDADVLIPALGIHSGDRVFSIGSAGDNSFSMLVNDPELVVAVDINPIQLQLIELKKAAITTLSYEEFLQFLGFQTCVNRWDLFQKVKVLLTTEQQELWTLKREEIEEGIIYQGKFEKYFSLFRQKILPLIHSKKRVARLFAEKSEEEQKKYFQEKWNNRRWRMLFKVFFSKFVMGRLGRDPKFLKEVEVPVATFILNTARQHLSSVNCQHNYFLQFILTGRFNTDLPHYARRENFDKIKSRIDRVITYNGWAEDTLKKYQGFNRFNLSNIFEYMNLGLFKKVSENFFQKGLADSTYAYWNLMVPRQMSTIIPGLTHRATQAQQLNEKDKGFFYGNFIIDVKS